MRPLLSAIAPRMRVTDSIDAVFEWILRMQIRWTDRPSPRHPIGVARAKLDGVGPGSPDSPLLALRFRSKLK